jgi:hypothetical protein
MKEYKIKVVLNGVIMEWSRVLKPTEVKLIFNLGTGLPFTN